MALPPTNIPFTTRPEITGTFGVVSTTHYLGTQIGMKMLEAGGNAIDAACAAGFALQVAEPHLCGPAGDVPILIHVAREKRVVMVCGQGGAPARATQAAFEKLGVPLIPGTGLLPAVVPGAFAGWTTALEQYGTMTLEEVLTPAMELARDGLVPLQRTLDTIATLENFFKAEWPTSHATWLPGGRVPQPGKRMTLPEMATSFGKLIDAEKQHRHKGREAAIAAAREAFYTGFVAEAIDRFTRDAVVMDATGSRHPGFLRGDDLAGFAARVEAPTSIDAFGMTVHKGGPWSQGPVLLQALRLLEGQDLKAMGRLSADFVHTVVESLKLAFADREVYYGDPDFADVPLETLLSREYAAERRTLIDAAKASLELRPGSIPGHRNDLRFLDAAQEPNPTANMAGVGEPVLNAITPARGDTVHVDAIDREGNMVAATPSGGWLQSSPVIPGLGFQLGTRGQMFWVKAGHPNSLAPGKRPRTTLTPTMVTRDGQPYMAFGTPGGDTQDQWNLNLFLRHVVFGLNLQESIDAPNFNTAHFPSSFYPRAAQPGSLTLEGRFPKAVAEDLKRRGHAVAQVGDWEVGRQCAASIDTADGILRAGSSPRAMSGLAVGR